MLISHRHRFAFIHVTKSAGSSIERALTPLLPPPPPRWWKNANRYLWPIVPGRWQAHAQHTTARQLRSRLGPARYERYLTFAFVRNPWDRLVSEYAYLLATPTHRHHRRVRSMRGIEQYLDFEIARGRPSQADFLTDREGRVIVDFVGRFETLHEDFRRVCDRLGLDAELPHLNASAHRDYRSYYSDEAAARVGRHFRHEIDLFGYAFDTLVEPARRWFARSGPDDEPAPPSPIHAQRSGPPSDAEAGPPPPIPRPENG